MTERNNCLVIYFESADDFQNGETIKGHNVINVAKAIFPSVSTFSTRGWKRNPMATFFRLRRLLKTDCVFLVLAINGAKYLGSYLTRCIKKRGIKIFYFMVGVGPLRLEATRKLDYKKITYYFQHENSWKASRSSFSKTLCKFSACFVESLTIKKMCERVYGAKNIVVLPNFRMDSELVSPSNDNLFPKNPLHFVYFSRINEEKGIFDLLRSCECLYREGHRFSLDIYGSLQLSKNIFLDKIDNRFGRYCGVCSSDQTQILSKYDALIFPTRSFEGMPGVIVESFFAGTPVISSEFTFSHDLIVDGENGYLYPFGDGDALTCVLRRVLKDPTLLSRLRKESQLSASNYLFSNCVGMVLQKVEEKG